MPILRSTIEDNKEFIQTVKDVWCHVDHQTRMSIVGKSVGLIGAYGIIMATTFFTLL